MSKKEKTHGDQLGHSSTTQLGEEGPAADVISKDQTLNIF